MRKRWSIAAPALHGLIVLLVATSSARAADPVSDAGQWSLAFGAGPVSRHGDWGVEPWLGFEAGLGSDLELAFPLALGWQVLDAEAAGGLELAAGVVDLTWRASEGAMATPALALHGLAVLGPAARLIASFDLSGQERATTDHHPAWLRGAAALELALGQRVRLAAGIAYRRLALDDRPEDEPGSAAAGSRTLVSFGAVRATPFSDVPTLTVRLFTNIALAMKLRADVDPEARGTDVRGLVGFIVTGGPTPPPPPRH